MMEKFNINFEPFPELRTERLDLIQLKESDAADLHKMRADVNIMRYIPRTLSEKVEDALALIRKSYELLEEGNHITWAIKFKGEEKLIGTIGYYRIQKENHRGEVGYILHPDFHGKGIMQEALEAVLNYGFNSINFHSIEAVIDPHNIASEKLLLRNNFIKEGYFKENTFFEGKYLDSVVYSLLRK